MIVLSWTGKAVSKNRAKQPSRGRLISMEVYKAFLESLAFSWIATKSSIKEPLPIKRFSIVIKLSIGPRMDPQNLITPIFDSLQNAEIITNDRDVNVFCMLPSNRHAQGADDQIIVIVDGN